MPEIIVTESGVVLLSTDGSSYPLALTPDQAETIAGQLSEAARRARQTAQG